MSASASKTNSHKIDVEQNFIRESPLQKGLPLASFNRENINFLRENDEYNKTYQMIHQEYSVLAEYEMIKSENIQGVYVIPSKESCLVWFGVIFVRSGLYENGIFRFTIILDADFPKSTKTPKVIFQSRMFHPVINESTRELALETAFPKWSKTEHIWQILKYLQWIFKYVKQSLSHGVNKEAIQLFNSDLDSFNTKVKETVDESQVKIYDPPKTEDPYYISFDVYNPEIHDRVHKAMLTPTSEDNFYKSGTSWVLPGSSTSLSKPPSPDLGNS